MSDKKAPKTRYCPMCGKTLELVAPEIYSNLWICRQHGTIYPNEAHTEPLKLIEPPAKYELETP